MTIEDQLIPSDQLGPVAGINLSKSTRRRAELAGQFPQRVRITKRIYGYRKSEIDAWLKSQAQARPPAPGKVQRVSAEDMSAFHNFFADLVSRIREAGHASRRVEFEGGAFAVVLPKATEAISFYTEHPDGQRVVMMLMTDAFEPFTSDEPEDDVLFAPAAPERVNVADTLAGLTAANLTVKEPGGQWHELPPLDLDLMTGFLKVLPPKGGQ